MTKKKGTKLISTNQKVPKELNKAIFLKNAKALTNEFSVGGDLFGFSHPQKEQSY